MFYLICLSYVAIYILYVYIRVCLHVNVDIGYESRKDTMRKEEEIEILQYKEVWEPKNRDHKGYRRVDI